MAAALDGQIELVAGAFSSDAARSKATGRELFLAEDRCYGSYEEMFEAEAQLPADHRIEFAAIVTPNFLHFPVAKSALEHGFHVLSDKPATLDLAEAKELAKIVARTGLLYGLTHNYTGYPLVKEARDIVRSGRLGAIRKVIVEYPQGWLAQRLEDSGQKQADWRTDPKRAGITCCFGDIGTHAENLAEYVTGLKIEALCADLTTFVPGRVLDDDANVLLRFHGGAKGILHASQISIGEENGLNLRVHGEKGSLAWRQEEPNTLVLRWPDRPREVVRAGNASLGAAAKANTRLPMGHPEGFLEAFANLYRHFAAAVRARKEGKPLPAASLDLPGIDDAVRGMAFIEAVVASSRSGEKWYPFSY